VTKSFLQQLAFLLCGCLAVLKDCQ